jgi:hypothetical protein
VAGLGILSWDVTYTPHEADPLLIPCSLVNCCRSVLDVLDIAEWINGEGSYVWRRIFLSWVSRRLRERRMKTSPSPRLFKAQVAMNGEEWGFGLMWFNTFFPLFPYWLISLSLNLLCLLLFGWVVLGTYKAFLVSFVFSFWFALRCEGWQWQWGRKWMIRLFLLSLLPVR